MIEGGNIAQFPSVGRVVEQQLRDMDVVHELSQALLDRGWAKPKVEVVSEVGGSYLEALQAAKVTKSVKSA